MKITDVRIAHNKVDGDGPLLASAAVTLDGVLVIHDVKLIRGMDGNIFLSFPSRKLQDKCPHCGGKNPLAQKFCGGCGVRLGERQAVVMVDGKPRLHLDVVHPLSLECRQWFQREVMKAYEATPRP